MLTVKDYGAVGDGVTDDTLSLLMAFSSGVYLFPLGDYRITSASVVSQLAKSDGPGYIIFNGLRFPASSIVDNCVYQVSVPEMFPTIQAAIDFFRFKKAANNAWFRIQVDNGQYRVKNINLQVKDWRSLQIIGNESNPDDCELIVDATDNGCGFIANNGFGCGIINGFSIIGDGGWNSRGNWNNQCYGAAIYAERNSVINLGPSMKSDKLYYGVRAKFGATINCDPGVIVSNAGDCGFHAYAASILANKCTALNCSHTNGENLGFGFCAEAGGHIECEMSNAEGCQVAGFYSLGNASMWAHGCESYRNIGHGFYALNGGYLEANGHAALRHSNAFDNGGAGYCALNGGIMQTSMSWADRNGGGNYITSNQGLLIS